MLNNKFILLFVLFVATTLSLRAGWIVTQRSYDSDQGIESAISEKVYLQDDIMKVVQDQMITIFNLNTETITLISPAKKVYWNGKVADYKVEIKNAMQSAMEEQLLNASADQKEMIRKMYQGMMESIDNPSKFAGEEPEEYELQIEKTNQKERIAGRLAVKYKILVNGNLKEEAWLSESERANAEFDAIKFHEIFKDFISQAGTTNFYQSHDQYIEFSKKGFPLKSVNYHGGYESISEVTNLEKKNLDPSEFKVPDNYKKVNITSLDIGN
jgi:hypothetical protein